MRKADLLDTQALFDDADVIYAYSRAQAIEDGVLVDATIGDLADVSRQHYKYRIAMTAAVFGLIEKAVNHPDWCNDYTGVWHDILDMSRNAGRSIDQTTKLFPVKIMGAGRKQWHTLKIVCHPGDQAELKLQGQQAEAERGSHPQRTDPPTA